MTDVVVHIGTGKTGTSSLQEVCGRNRDLLAEHGVLYPRSVGRFRHVRLGLMTMPVAELDRMIAWQRIGSDDPTGFQAQVREEIVKEVREAALPRVLFSNEGFYGSSPDSIRGLRDFLDQVADRVRIVVYLRRQDDHLLSRYQQRVKVGATDRLVDRLDADLSGTYDYATRLGLWQRTARPEELVVRPFEREQLSGGSLYRDFAEATGLTDAGVDLDALAPTGRTNESLDADAVEFVRLRNIHLVESQGAKPGKIDNRALVARLAARGSGPTLGLPDEALDRFMARWAESNATVARELLGREDGVLFHSSQRSQRVVTEQRLAPERLEELLEVAGSPAEERDAIRAVAAREAG